LPKAHVGDDMRAGFRRYELGVDSDRLAALAHGREAVSKYAMAILPRLPDLMACKTSGLRSALT
jgi:hypothetical protein